MKTELEKISLEMAREAAADARELTRKTIETSGKYRRRSLNMAVPTDEQVCEENILGHWSFEAVEIPGVGIRREIGNNGNYSFEFFGNGCAIAHVNGRSYKTAYTVKEGCIAFEHAELASLKLELSDDRLRMHNHLGAELVFCRTA